MLLNLLIDFILISVSLLATFYFKKGDIFFSAKEIEFISVFYFSWFVSTIISKKTKSFSDLDKHSLYKKFLISFFLMIGIIIISNQFFNFENVSRYIIGGSLFLGLFLESIWIFVTPHKKVEKEEKFKFYTASIYAFILDLLLITWIIFFEIVEKINVFEIHSEVNLLILSIYLIWFLSGLTFHRYQLEINSNYWKFIWKYLKAYFFLIFASAFLTFFLRVTPELEKSILFTIIIYSLWSFLVFTFYFFIKIPKRTDDTRLKFIKATELSDELFDERNIKSNGKYVLSNYKTPGMSIKNKLKEVYLKRFENLFDKIDDKIDLDTIDINRSVVIRSSDPYNVETLPDDYLDIFINLHELNDIRRLNAYLIDINKRLRNGGIFIGNFEPIKNRHKRFLQRYPFFIAKLFYSIDFVWKRVFPKIPVIQKIYFAFTKGRDRALSMAEGLGRLYYCGFEIIDIFEIGYEMVFIAVKVKEPSKDINPSYGPFFKMRRIGLNGKDIYVYKTRTMHPYSEYLQKFVFEMNSLDDGGKLKNDFRITTWGKVLRKLWLDEFPMFINFFKGEMKLVGVRPLSKHYFSLYPDDLKELRVKTKPGLVPPFYVDLPGTLEEIFESERKYLEKYFKSPLKTDMEYFVKSWYNILIKRARSG
ncbi:MAG: sugar transferase [Melioribacteraceae bacterium]|nr:sugar transferase [Melioribacteraceae bacterium]